MRRALAVARLNLIELFRDRTELMSVIVLPIVLTWVFGTAFGSVEAQKAVKIPVADLDRSSYSRSLLSQIDSSKAFEIDRMTAEKARDIVASGDAPMAVIVPKGFGTAVEGGEAATIETVRYPTSNNARAAEQLVQGAVERLSANVTAARSVTTAFPSADSVARFREAYALADAIWRPEPPVSVKVSVAQASATRESELEAPANTQYSLGFTVFFVFMTALGSAGGVLEDRELGTLRRVLATPVRRAELLGGKVLGVALVASFEAAILVGFGSLVFGVPWGKDPLAITVLLLSMVLAATGLGVMVSALVRTRSQMSATAPVLSTALAMLGGCYWPVEVTSPTMQTIAKLTPTGWAMAGMKDVVARGLGLEAVLLPVLALLAFAAVSITIGVTRLRLE